MTEVMVIGGKEAGIAVLAIVGRVRATTPVGVRDIARDAVVKIRGHMGGRPGPNRISGNLQESLRVQQVSAMGFAVYPDGGNAPYARRIELGFVGADSLGRYFNQPPYPYFFPGIREMAGDVVRVHMAEVWGRAIAR